MENRPSATKNPVFQPEMDSASFPARITREAKPTFVRQTSALKRIGSRLQVLPGLLIFIAAFGVGSLAVWYTGSPAPPLPAAVVSPSGLKYVDLVAGEGATPVLGQTVTVHYIGWLENGTEFSSSYKLGRPAQFTLGPSLIPGWNEALQTMKLGGKRRITVPPQLAYKEIGRPPTIPGNATLTFEIELLGVE